jgi:uncharacterized Rmd1/YagE family protein
MRSGSAVVVEIATRLRVSVRNCLRKSESADINHLWRDSSNKNVRYDRFLNNTNNLNTSKKEIKLEFVNFALDHVQSLTVQGRAVSAIVETLSSSSITRWSSFINTLTSPLTCFVIKALLQQLPTFVNLQRWHRVSTNLCPLCQKPQTNKHVLNNCSDPTSLERYKTRHDAVLQILSNWLQSVKNPATQLFVDLGGNNITQSTSLIFKNFRPDVAIILPAGSIVVWELTICHETNILQSREFKRNKYSQLSLDRHPKFAQNTISVEATEVTSLGFISDTSSFCKKSVTQALPTQIANLISKTVITNSLIIYKNRNGCSV